MKGPFGKTLTYLRQQLRPKMVHDSQPERCIVLWLRDPFDHFLV